MKYISGIHALNIPCSLNTYGDWHCSALDWEHIKLHDSEQSIFGDYGIESNKNVPEHKELFNVANTIRALLDLLDQGLFSVAQGMRRDFVGTSEYDEEIFSQVLKLKDNGNWMEINTFMEKEYLMKWVKFRKEHENG